MAIELKGAKAANIQGEGICLLTLLFWWPGTCLVWLASNF